MSAALPSPAAEVGQGAAGGDGFEVGLEVDDGGPAGLAGGVEGGGEVLGALHRRPPGAEGGGEGGEVGVGEVGGDHPAGKRALLVHADRVVGAVVDLHCHHARPVLDGGGQLIGGHHE